MKLIMITLCFLTFGGVIKLDTFEIQQECSSWFHSNITAVEKKKKTFMSNHYYHMYEGNRIIGYVWGVDEPR